ncbi:hypothetical protein FIBSPDRAFT_973564 [Athelia psychrophila]|uniref:Uncharacterized protein n=1 Tax=Athelia psychrophila TaxID=1759441 RepID=A0A166G2F0_9AGAM|nr:hypothetical protein FIBSPDRAFT_973564 [Fibularhizoctonia sp. CBS 109695]
MRLVSPFHPIRTPEPLLPLELDDTSCSSLDWANSEVLVVGSTNGNIAVFKSSRKPSRLVILSVRSTSQLIAFHGPFNYLLSRLPMHCFNQYQSAIHADSTIFSSGGYDGITCLVDVRDPQTVLTRTRGLRDPDDAFLGVMIDSESSIKAFSASPGMLGRGHHSLESSGPVWSVPASDYHPKSLRDLRMARLSPQIHVEIPAGMVLHG